MSRTNNNTLSGSIIGLQDEADTLGNALAVLEKARASGLDAPSEEAVHRRRDERGYICEIDDAGAFSFARGILSASPEVIHFTPQETVALWHFWRVLGYADMALGIMRASELRKTSEPSHE